MALTRRAFVAGSFGAAGGMALAACHPREATDALRVPFSDGERLEVLDWPLADPPPFGTAVGSGWDGRRYTDLAKLDLGGAAITPTAQFFVRTFPPDSLASRAARDADWSIRIGGLAGEDVELPLASLRTRSLGRVLIECAGNDATSAFGLMSCADWRGVPLAEALAPLRAAPRSTALWIGGVDDHAVPSRGGHSQPGAAWVFAREEIERTGAFLATGINGAPLPAEHGAPVRLVVPGWYGCCHVKWVDAIRFCGPDEPATAQMREFARRTHQRGVPELARDYAPAAIDAAALPVRVERWRVAGETWLRIVGIAWGGGGRARELSIRIDPDGLSEHVRLPPARESRAWEVWEHAWRPASSGTHVIRCRFDDRISQRRQRAGLHDRRIAIGSTRYAQIISSTNV